MSLWEFLRKSRTSLPSALILWFSALCYILVVWCEEDKTFEVNLHRLGFRKHQVLLSCSWNTCWVGYVSVWAIFKCEQKYNETTYKNRKFLATSSHLKDTPFIQNLISVSPESHRRIIRASFSLLFWDLISIFDASIDWLLRKVLLLHKGIRLLKCDSVRQKNITIPMMMTFSFVWLWRHRWSCCWCLWNIPSPIQISLSPQWKQ